MKLVILLLTINLVFISAVTLKSRDGKHVADVDPQVVDMLKTLSLEEKIGQMTQLDCVMFTQDGSISSPIINVTALNEIMRIAKPGSLFNNQMKPEEWVKFITTIQKSAAANGVLPILYGTDSVHGANYVYGSAMYPHHITSAGSFSPSLLKQEGMITARDTRAVGIPWMFSPVLDVAFSPAWSRVYETFGEDPYLISAMGSAYVQGVQGGDGAGLSCPTCCAACLKHYLGYGAPYSGKDRTSALLSRRTLMQYIAPPFQAAINAGTTTAMINSGDLDGIPVHASYEVVTEILRKVLKFPSSGVTVTDYQDIQKLVTWHHVAENNTVAVMMALDAGLDMSMVPLDYSFNQIVLDLVRRGLVTEDRLDVSVARILQLKKNLGILSDPVAPRVPKSLPGDRALSLQMARESIVLVKNDQVLPLSSKNPSPRILVTGPCGKSLRMQNGGWTIHWQGADESELTDGTTIYQGLSKFSNSTFIQGIDVEAVRPDRQAAIDAIAKNDVVVLCLGENPYAEVFGDIPDLTLPQVQRQYAADVRAAAKDKPVIVVLVEGRPRVLGNIVKDSDAVLVAMLPGPEGGQAIAEIIFGSVNPSGRLAITYPSGPNDLCTHYRRHAEPCKPLWSFGYGLSYSTFKYSDLSLQFNTWTSQPSMDITVSVTNTGAVAGNETVLMFVSDLIASVAPPRQLLKGFTKVELAPGTAKKVKLTLLREHLMMYNVKNEAVIEDGQFEIKIQGSGDTAPLSQIFTYKSV